ncbi:hypothetical protein, partial [Petrocella sp. FN5]|uniref:hypothetical protein n=1 Tax=Petrocella sp. FN5 TaxID=3032002 RepID=UPI0023DCB19F
MKRITIVLSMIVFSIFLINFSDFKESYASQTSSYIDIFRPIMNLEEAIKDANVEMNSLMDRDYFFYRIYDVDINTFVEIDANEDIWQEYGIFSTKSPSGKYKFINELQAYPNIPNSQWEFIGYNIMPEPVPNPYYTPDSMPKTQIMGRWKWVQNPEVFLKNNKALASYLSLNYKDALTPT